MTSAHSSATSDAGTLGRRLLPTLIDERASSSPEDTFVAIPRSVDLKEGYRDISYGVFSAAVNQCARWLERSLGMGQDQETLGYIGPSDLLYPIIALAAVKTGYKVRRFRNGQNNLFADDDSKALFSSPRNTLEAHLSLIDETKCVKFLIPEKKPPIVRQILREKEMKVVQIASLDFFLQPVDVAPYPYNKNFDEARYMPFLALHTSGSTGLPKSVILNHGTFSSMDAYNLISSLGGRDVIGPSLKGTRMLVGFPLTHTAAYTLLLGLAVYYGVVGVLPPAYQPLTANLADQIHRLANVQGTALPPTTLIDIYNEPKQLRRLGELQYVFFAGSTLPKKVGDTIAAATNLATLIGSTEMGYLPIEITDRSDWDYVAYSPFYGSEFQPTGTDGLFEHCVVRNKDLDLFQSIFSTYPYLSEFCTKDLYEKHPTKENLWRYRGRIDDLIVFSNGEKLNPNDMEDMISVHPAVMSALIGGEGKFHSFLLVEPVDSPSDQEARSTLLDDIWPTVQRANESCPSFGRIMKDCIIFTRFEKPVLRAAKGTVQRKATLMRYQDEIDIVCDLPDLPKGLPRGLVSGPEDLHNYLRRIVAAIVPLKEDLTDDADLFELGLESLQAIALSKQINAYLKRYMPNTQHVSAEIVYAHSSLAELEKSLADIGRSAAPSIDVDKMQDVFEESVTNLPSANDNKRASGQSFVVLLTGSTGSLGSYILSSLASNPDVEMIYCLNRGENAQTRQMKSFEEKGLVFDSEKMTFLHYSLSEPDLGLEHTVYETLAQSVTHVLHSAWDLNFLRSLDSYASSHLKGIQYLVNFAAQAKRLNCLVFLSTVATATAWAETHEDPIPETIMNDWYAAESMGYAESKSIAERLLAAASEKSGLRTAICRLGQIAGPTTKSGSWNQREWIPSLIESSMYLGKLPASLGSRDLIDWIPVDIAAQIVVDLIWESENKLQPPTTQTSLPSSKDTLSDPTSTARNVLKRDSSDSQSQVEQTTKSEVSDSNGNVPALSKATSAAVYNIVNPSTTTWPTIVPVIKSACTVELDIVSFPEWLEALQSSGLNPHMDSDGSEIEKNPALKLLQFLKSMEQQIQQPTAVFSTDETVKASRTLATLPAVGAEWMENWMRQWRFT